METDRNYTAFAGERLIVSGNLKTMLLKTKAQMDKNENESILIFDDQTGQQVDFDFRGTPDDVLARLSSHPLFKDKIAEGDLRSGPGRPKLGVVCREISLLPRHWEWLEKQPGGISVSLRKLIDEARKRTGGADLVRAARDAAGKFMWAIAGNLPHFEEASRALYANDEKKFADLIADWPVDIRDHLKRLVDEAVRMEKYSADNDKKNG